MRETAGLGIVRLLLLLLCFASPIVAQEFDLDTMPSDYRFTDHGNNGNTTVTFEGRFGVNYVFRHVRDDSAGDPDIFAGWTNRTSQTVRWPGGEFDHSMSPHDCWPFIGECDYTVSYVDGTTYAVHTTMVLIGDIWVHHRYVDVDGVLTFTGRGCAHIDEYGFWIDYWTVSWDGKIGWAERVTTMGKPDTRSDLDTLTSFCEAQQDMVS